MLCSTILYFYNLSFPLKKKEDRDILLFELENLLLIDVYKDELIILT